MKNCAQHGFNDFVLCLGYKGWTIKRYFLDYHLANSDVSLTLGSAPTVHADGSALEENWHVTLAETGLNAMTGCRVKRIEKYVKGDHFLLTYGDGVADINLRQLIEFHKRHGKLGTVTAVRPPGRFGEIELDGIQVAEFNEKPLVTRGRINGGFFVLHRKIFERLSTDEGLVFEQAPLIRLARDGELMAYLHDGFWQPMDNSRDYKYLNELWNQDEAPWNNWSLPRVRAAA
jgi:glucose-1-phosphate cytidylyltransferase